MKEYTKMIQNMFRFQGRARRREYWVVVLINSAISSFICAAMFFVCTMAGDPLCYRVENTYGFTTEGSRLGTISAVVVVICMLYILFSILALTVRRYHDVGLPGWLFPICLAGTLFFGIGAICHLVICFISSKEDNKYGNNPKAVENNEYESGSGIFKSIIMYIICFVLMVASVRFNIMQCGWLYYF